MFQSRLNSVFMKDKECFREWIEDVEQLMLKGNGVKL